MSVNTPFSFMGAADALIDILTDEGVSTGLELKGNCTSFAPKPDSERKEQTSNGRSNYGQVISSVVLPKPMTAKIAFNQVDKNLFAMAFFGTNADMSQASGTLTNSAVVTVHDKWVPIGKYMLGTMTVQNEANAITYVLGTDYEINPRLGLIKALSTGAITSGQTVEVSGTYSAVTGSTMSAMTKSNVRIRVMLDGQNFADGRNFIADIKQMRLNPTKEFELLGNDFATVEFEGILETPTGGSTPMTHTWLS